MSDADLAKSTGQEIACFLDDLKRRTYDQIQNYPTPITGCDQQFNCLLEEQARVIEELEGLRRLLAEAPARDELTVLLGGFLRSSSCLDDDATQRFQSQLQRVETGIPGNAAADARIQNDR